MTINAREFDHLVDKFGLETRNSGDLLAWFVYDGRRVTRTRRSKKSSGDLPMQHSIRQQLKLNEDQMRSAVGCHMTRDEYIEILRARGII